MDERHLQIMGTLEALAQARHFVHQAALELGLNEQAAHHCSLAVDEACTNIVEHGYHGVGAHQVIDIFCGKDDKGFVVTLLDDSPAFDPLAVPEPNPATSMSEREPGGWGVFLIKKLMDDVLYDRQGGRNRLLMIKRL
jgi:anti-sigma regulatory factor (Ser/Thr protein kinase)